VLAAAGQCTLTSFESLDAYGWLVGSWDLDVYNYFDESSNAPQRSQVEVHFGWVLESRAVQDVWIMAFNPRQYVPRV